MKRLLFAGVTASTLAIGGYAFASSVNVSSADLSAGTTATLSCQPTTPIVVDYPMASLTYDASISGYKVTSINLTGVGAGCVGSTAKVELTTNDNGTALATSSVVTLTLGTNAVAIPGVVAASDITGVSIVIV